MRNGFLTSPRSERSFTFTPKRFYALHYAVQSESPTFVIQVGRIHELGDSSTLGDRFPNISLIW